ncbi:MAG: ATP-binding cassette domain-containing protein [Flavobacteriales bacterium]|nr:ATP-binding cassette domain-containing protein [Crocinitomicaceae bacterium]NBX81089.1 ATP-binding cassette domain-containing protein [Flavobacteriales bacterium]NCA20408.1 ATP-binding cassette domain-containing protein [Crocinitomicaceae bacterium]
MVEIKNISKSFQQKDGVIKALDDVNLSISKGDIVGIIGTSGAGKSTLIRCLNLLEKPDEGEIIINGNDLTKLDARDLQNERKKIGMIFQHINLFSSKTVYENIALPLRFAGESRHEIKRKVLDLLDLVGLKDKANEYPSSLSGGQKQRVAIARSLVTEPYFLLCDEATSALDPINTNSILQLLGEINQKLGLTILLITHEMDVVKSICNQIAIIEKGKIISHGSLDEIYDESQKNESINSLLHSNSLNMPLEFTRKIKNEFTEGLHPLLEIQLNGNVKFEAILKLLLNTFKIPHTILKADVEYFGKANFGQILIQLKGNVTENDSLIHYLSSNNVNHSIKGYA